MKKTFKQFALLTPILLALLFSCKPDDKGAVDFFVGSGAYIINEGAYGQGNGDISYYKTTNNKDNIVNNGLFKLANERVLGDIPSSILFHETEAFIVVNNSQPTKIEVVSANKFKSKSLITGFTSPRKILKINNTKAYVSDMGEGKIHILNLSSKSITGFISTGKSVESMLLHNNKVFAANWTNMYVSKENNSVQVIDANTDQVVKTIELVKEPQSMVLDKNNKLWVLCSGGWDPKNDTLPALFKINPDTYEIEKTFWFKDKNLAPTSLCISLDKQSLYFLCGQIYKMGIDDAELPALTSPFITTPAFSLSCLEVCPATGDLYAGNPKDYSQNGEVYRYASNGSLMATLSVGIAPGGIIFR